MGYLEQKIAAPVYKAENTAVGIRHADHAIPLYPQKLALTSSARGDRWVSIFRSWTKATVLLLLLLLLIDSYLQ
jgi:hypothetical protein